MKTELDLSLNNRIKFISHGKHNTLCKVRALYKHQYHSQTSGSSFFFINDLILNFHRNEHELNPDISKLYIKL